MCLHTHRAPPQGISIGSEFFVELVLHKVDEERREDENQKADVPGSDQLLQAEVRTDFQCVNHTRQNLVNGLPAQRLLKST